MKKRFWKFWFLHQRLALACWFCQLGIQIRQSEIFICTPMWHLIGTYGNGNSKENLIISVFTPKFRSFLLIVQIGNSKTENLKLISCFVYCLCWKLGKYEGGKVDATFSFKDDDFVKVATGKMNPQIAFIRFVHHSSWVLLNLICSAFYKCVLVVLILCLEPQNPSFSITNSSFLLCLNHNPPLLALLWLGFSLRS